MVVVPAPSSNPSLVEVERSTCAPGPEGCTGEREEATGRGRASRFRRALPPGGRAPRRPSASASTKPTRIACTWRREAMWEPCGHACRERSIVRTIEGARGRPPSSTPPAWRGRIRPPWARLAESVWPRGTLRKARVSRRGAMSCTWPRIGMDSWRAWTAVPAGERSPNSVGPGRSSLWSPTLRGTSTPPLVRGGYGKGGGEAHGPGWTESTMRSRGCASTHASTRSRCWLPGTPRSGSTRARVD